MIITPPSFDPTLTRQLIVEMLHSDCTIPQLAEQFKLSFTEFLAIIKSPEAQAQLDALAQLTALHTQIRASTRRETALARLTRIVEFTLNELEARRAASTILKELRTASPTDHDAAPPDCPIPVPPTCPQVGADEPQRLQISEPPSNNPSPSPHRDSTLTTRDLHLSKHTLQHRDNSDSLKHIVNRTPAQSPGAH